MMQLTLVIEHPDCKLNTNKANECKTKYQVPANYQVLTDEAENSYSKQDYLSFLTEYDGAESYYSLFKLKDYGLKVVPLYDVILSKDDYRLAITATQFYIESSQPMNALNLLKYLKNKSYPSELTKGFQERLAVRLAKTIMIQKSKVLLKTISYLTQLILNGLSISIENTKVLSFKG